MAPSPSSASQKVAAECPPTVCLHDQVHKEVVVVIYYVRTVVSGQINPHTYVACVRPA